MVVKLALAEKNISLTLSSDPIGDATQMTQVRMQLFCIMSVWDLPC